jgi:hypothetical protein
MCAGLAEAVNNLGSRICVYDVPCLGFAMKASRSLARMSVEIIGIDLHGWVIGSVDKFYQPEKILANVRVPLRSRFVLFSARYRVSRCLPEHIVISLNLW